MVPESGQAPLNARSPPRPSPLAGTELTRDVQRQPQPVKTRRNGQWGPVSGVRAFFVDVFKGLCPIFLRRISCWGSETNSKDCQEVGKQAK